MNGARSCTAGTFKEEENNRCYMAIIDIQVRRDDPTLDVTRKDHLEHLLAFLRLRLKGCMSPRPGFVTDHFPTHITAWWPRNHQPIRYRCCLMIVCRFKRSNSISRSCFSAASEPTRKGNEFSCAKRSASQDSRCCPVSWSFACCNLILSPSCNCPSWHLRSSLE